MKKNIGGMNPRNPAAVAARLRGDIDNFIVAATPGGIEAQEARGQRDLCSKAQLPRNGTLDRAPYEAMGITFGEVVDDLFIAVTLPEGWKIEPTDHSMHNNLVDAKGHKRAGIFYKAAFYDERADIHIVTRFSVTRKFCNAEGVSPYDGNKPPAFEPTHQAYTVQNCGAEVYCATVRERASYANRSPEWYAERDAEEKADRLECEVWLAERYPDWKNSAAYWD